MPAAKAPPAVKPAAAIQPAAQASAARPAIAAQTVGQATLAAGTGGGWNALAAPGQPVEPAGNPFGETRFGHDFSHVPVQAKLQVNEPGDEYEREADRVAEIVARPGPQHSGAIAPLRITPFVQREPAPEMERNDDALVEARMLDCAGTGRPLPAPVRKAMEDRFGVKLDSVRVHTGSEASRMANEIDAVAFTHGRNIYFADGQFAPGTPAGDRLLGHELTHVVQQAGGASGPKPVQRSRLSGRGFHAATETRFLSANKNILTEAPLPGATTGTKFDFEAVGFPDLYKGDPNKAIGVRGEWLKTKETVNPEDDPGKKHGFANLTARQRKADSPSGAVTYSPTVQGDSQPFTAEFPTKIEVGDIKPIWMVAGVPVVEHAGTGTAQLANYGNGFKEFVKIAAAKKKVTRGTVETDVLKGLTIPPELDYKNFDKENKSPSSNLIGIEGVTGRRRYWMFEPPGTGLYYYFSLAHPNPAAEGRAKLEETFKKLEPIPKALHTPDTGIHGKLNLSKLPKRKNGATGPSARTKAGDKAAGTPAPARDAKVIQRKNTPREKKDWSALGKAWEKDRADWDAKFAKPLLSSKEGKALNERTAINHILKLNDDTAPGIATQAKELGSVEVWSGRTGIALGKLRFALGATFDKVAAAFDWIKEKLAKIWAKISGTTSKFVGIGWRKTLVNLLTKAIKLGFRELVSVFFELCANCLEGVIDKFVSKFKEDASDALHDQIAELQKQFERFQENVKAEFETRFGSWDKLLANLETAEEIASIVTTMEALIRLGMQVVSCLTPPALGCLWGLVAQVGLEVALSLIMGTEWFQEHVINHPSVRNLIKEFAGPTIRSLIADTLRGVGLDAYAADVDACNKVKEIEVPPVPAIDPVTPEQFQAHRAEWERVNRPQMLQDLQFRFQSRPGVPASEADLEQLVAAMQRSGKGSEELQKVINSTPKWSNGRLDVEAIKRGMGSGGGPGAPGGSGGVPGITKQMPSPSGPRLRWGPLDPVPDMPGSDRNRSPGAVGPRIEF